MAHRPTDNSIIYLYNKLTPDKVLDVSSMTEDGKGIVTITAPKTTRSRKYSVEPLRIVSNNRETYDRAIISLGPEYYGYIERFRTIFENAEQAYINPVMHMLNKLTPDKVLDVSSMTEDGKGIVTITAPKTTRSRKYSVEPLRIVSNNPESYERAIFSLGPEYYGYIERFRTIFENAERAHTTLRTTLINPPPPIPLPRQFVNLTPPLSPPRVVVPTAPLSPPRVVIPGAVYSPPTLPTIVPLGRMKEDTIPQVAPTLPTIVTLDPMTVRTFPTMIPVTPSVPQVPAIPRVTQAIRPFPKVPQVPVVQIPGIPNIPPIPGFGP